MAGNDGERRMVFDVRGRRKNVVKVVYAILAILMGLSLFLVVGPAPLSDLFGTGSSTSSAATQFEDQAERLEVKLKKEPQDPALLLALTRAQINAGNALVEGNPATGEVFYGPDSRQHLAEASETWSKYLKATDEPSSSGAQVAAQALFALAQTSRTNGEVLTNVRAAEQAQQIVAEQRPSLGSLSTLAIYRYYAFDFDGADEAGKKAAGFANTKFERENLENELGETRKRGKEFEKQVAKIEKEAKEAREKGQPAVANPLGENNPLAAP